MHGISSPSRPAVGGSSSAWLDAANSARQTGRTLHPARFSSSKRSTCLKAETAVAAGGDDVRATAQVQVEPQDEGDGEKPKGLKRVWKAVARFFGAGKEKPNLKQLGLYAVLSYGFVSNASYAVCTGVAWFISSKKSGLSPLAPDQWQLFLTVWAGMWAVNNVLRVPRLGVAVALAPTFDRFITFLMRKSGRGKTFATVLCVLLVNLIGTLVLMASSILLASALSGVPFWPVAAV